MLRERERRPPLSSDSRTKEIYDGDSEATFNTILSLVFFFLLQKLHANNVKLMHENQHIFYMQS